MKTINKKTIVISIILLLIGVSVSSAISVDTKSTKVDNVEDCGCNEVNNNRPVCDWLWKNIWNYLYLTIYYLDLQAKNMDSVIVFYLYGALRVINYGLAIILGNIYVKLQCPTPPF